MILEAATELAKISLSSSKLWDALRSFITPT